MARNPFARSTMQIHPPKATGRRVLLALGAPAVWLALLLLNATSRQHLFFLESRLAVEEILGGVEGRINTAATNAGTGTNGVEDEKLSSRQPRQQSPRRPLVILHIGPHKTSSTTIQQIMQDKAETTLTQDRFRSPGGTLFPACGWANFTGVKNTANLAIRLRVKCLDHGDAVDSLRQFLSASFAAGNNVILSSEEFARDGTNISLLHETIRTASPTPPDVRVVVFYRRFHDWITSAYAEMHKDMLPDMLLGKETHRHFRTLVEWLTLERIEEFERMFTWANKQRYHEAGFDRVEILPMISPTDGSPLDSTQLFFCHIGAEHTCANLQQKPQPRENPRFSMDSARLLYAAAGAKMFKHPNHVLCYLREKVARVHDHLQFLNLTGQVLKGNQSSFQTCIPGDVQEKLFAATVLYEQRMGCENGSSSSSVSDGELASGRCNGNVERLKQDFERKQRSGAFCDLNVEPKVVKRVLSDAGVRRFLRKVPGRK